MEILPSAPFCVPVPPPAQKVGLGIEGKRLLLHLLFIYLFSFFKRSVCAHTIHTCMCTQTTYTRTEICILLYLHVM